MHTIKTRVEARITQLAKDNRSEELRSLASLLQDLTWSCYEHYADIESNQQPKSISDLTKAFLSSIKSESE